MDGPTGSRIDAVHRRGLLRKNSPVPFVWSRFGCSRHFSAARRGEGKLKGDRIAAPLSFVYVCGKIKVIVSLPHDLAEVFFDEGLHMKSVVAKALPLSLVTLLRELGHSLSHLSAKKDVFSSIHDANGWKSTGTLSGPGSQMEETEDIRRILPDLLKRLQIKSMLDIPCGDFFWMSQIGLDDVHYVGAEIVPQLVETNRQRFGSSNREFILADLCKDKLPLVDLILCRDCLIHLSFKDAKSALLNLKVSGAKYLLVTTDPSVRANMPISTGQYRPLNLELPPFNMSSPIEVHRDRREPKLGEKLLDEHKSIALYRI